MYIEGYGGLNGVVAESSLVAKEGPEEAKKERLAEQRLTDKCKMEQPHESEDPGESVISMHPRTTPGLAARPRLDRWVLGYTWREEKIRGVTPGRPKVLVDFPSSARPLADRTLTFGLCRAPRALLGAARKKHDAGLLLGFALAPWWLFRA